MGVGKNNGAVEWGRGGEAGGGGVEVVLGWPPGWSQVRVSPEGWMNSFSHPLFVGPLALDCPRHKLETRRKIQDHLEIR